MEAGLTNHICTQEELCGLIPEKDAIRPIDKAIIEKALENMG